MNFDNLFIDFREEYYYQTKNWEDSSLHQDDLSHNPIQYTTNL